MKTASELSALLGICIVPQVVARIAPHYGGDEQKAIREFYLSELYDRLQSPDNFVREIDRRARM